MKTIKNFRYSYFPFLRRRDMFLCMAFLFALSSSALSQSQPSVTARASLGCGFAPLKISFSVAGSDPGGSMLTYKWLFGDGKEAVGAEVSHTYQSSGSYTAKVIATNEGGDSASTTIAILVSGSTPTQTDGRNYFVSPTGSDSNPGTEEAPFKTIQKAADLVKPGDTVLVDDGIYTYGGTSECFGKVIVCIHKGGAPDNWIVFRSKNKWGAKIDGENGIAATGFGFSLNAGYVRIQDFEIRGLANKDGAASGVTLYNGGSNTQIIGNHIHDNGRVCTDTQNGQNGIFIKEKNVLVEGNLIHDIGRFAPGQQGCRPSSNFWQNHDHGIYHDAGDNVTIRNNILYNFKHGWGVQVWPKSRTGMNIVNNTFAFSNQNEGKLGAIVFWAPSSGGMNVTDSNISNNIFYGVNAAALYMGTGGGPGIGFSNVRISNNIISNGQLLRTEGIVRTESGLSIANNKENTDPMFVDPSAYNFQLRAESPAIDAGMSLPEMVPNDYNGCTRLRGGAYDIGAYESSIATQQMERSPAKLPTGSKVQGGGKKSAIGSGSNRRKVNVRP
jgi:PKD repeat protein